MSHAQEIKINNYQEHLRILKSEIGIINDEINRRIKERDAIDVDSIKKEISDNGKYLEQLKEDIEIKELRLNELDEDIENDLDILNKWKESSEDEKTVFLESLREKEDILKQNISYLTDKNNLLNETISDIVKELEKLSNLCFERKEENEILLQNRNSLDSQIALLKDEGTSEINKLNSEIERLKKELDIYQKTVDEEKTKIKLPAENLRKRELEFKTKEKDIRVIINRMRKKYKELYPELEFNLE